MSISIFHIREAMIPGYTDEHACARTRARVFFCLSVCLPVCLCFMHKSTSKSTTDAQMFPNSVSPMHLHVLHRITDEQSGPTTPQVRRIDPTKQHSPTHLHPHSHPPHTHIQVHLLIYTCAYRVCCVCCVCVASSSRWCGW